MAYLSIYILSDLQPNVFRTPNLSPTLLLHCMPLDVHAVLDEYLKYHGVTKDQKEARGACLFVFWTKVTPELIAHLSDVYNLEMCLRLLSLSDSAKLRMLSGHVLAKKLLAKLLVSLVVNYFQGTPSLKEVRFTYGKYGKPSVLADFEFSISTSNDIVCVAVEIGSNTPIGVDLSHHKQDAVSPLEFMDQFGPMFTALEKTQLENIADLGKRYIAFNHLWTLKESFTKLIGSGLHIDLASFSFAMNVEPPTDSWTRSDIDTTQLKISAAEWHLSETYYCYTTTLDAAVNPPVLLSHISEANSQPPKTLFIDIPRMLTG